MMVESTRILKANTTRLLKSQGRDRKLLKILRKNQGLNITEIRNITKEKESYLKNALKRMEVSGLLRSQIEISDQNRLRFRWYVI